MDDIPILKVNLDIAQLQKAISKAVEEGFENRGQSNALPHVLDKTQLKEFLNIKDTKASELLNRPDFPVIRELGHPRVLTHLLIQWLEEHTEWNTL